ncbi:D-amino acid dehydrogenase [Ensifer sp. ENS05]|uniref:D-amino acid dehydrogenase n=1 Tax=Ensifer sp. ENS05 TaxID=2769277 RepID=UPI001784F6EB|nr:D-amino acid dehydrogenase [Ensifer sp. ENS05]MBD9596899.1 D-amino acid dehydrogenase [Ensifer sp. ENS05]
MKKIAVIGAGITGVTTAYALAKRGYGVTVFDGNRYPAMETSFANGGQLSASNAEVWNSWSTVVRGISWMLKTDAPFLLNPKPNWHKYSWLAEFVGNIGKYRSNTVETVRLALKARTIMKRIADEERIGFDHVSRGILHIYRDKPSFERAGRVNKLLTEGGLDRRSVGPSEIQQIEPAVIGEFYGGFFTASDSTGDIHKFTRGLALACISRGVTFSQGALVQRVGTDRDLTVHWRTEPTSSSTRSERFDGVVICAGVGSRHLASTLGDRVNVYPVKGYSITVHLDDDASRAAAPWVSLLDDQAKIVTSRLGADRFRVAGTAELNGENRDIRADRISPLVNWTRTHFPTVETDRVTQWSGLRPMMPSMLPKVGVGRDHRVFYNTGHGHLGWTLSAATAEMIAATIEGADHAARTASAA